MRSPIKKVFILVLLIAAVSCQEQQENYITVKN